MEQKQPGELFDLAVLLDTRSREVLCDLADLKAPDMGRRLREQLLRFQNFKGLLDKRDALSKLLIRLPTLASKIEREGIETPIHPTISNRPKAQAPPRIGHYRIEHEISSGGQGTVYLARQDATDRRVALKLIHAGSGLHPDDRERFKRELKVLAMMNHDHIAAIFEADTTTEGFPFFTMEYVDGSDILGYCRDKQLSPRQRLKLFIQICEGVAHAHQRLILHRDLKPGNILVTEVDGKPRVKIVDFGIARSLEGGIEMGERLTATGVIGTPGYLAPEMFQNSEPDTRLDIYALGVVLYHLVAGRAPLIPPDHLSWDEKWRYYREREPPKPSTFLPGKTSGASDLDAIILKAMAKEPERRYTSVIELKRDCRFFLEGQPVSARPPSRLYLLGKLIARNKALVSAAALILLSLFLGLVATGLAQRKAQMERYRFEKSFETLERILAAPDPYRMGAQARLIDVLRIGEADFEEDFDQDRELEAMIRAVWGQTYYGLGFYKDARSHLQKTVAIMTQNHGRSDSRTLNARHQLAKVEIREGHFDRAESELRQIYKLYPTTEYHDEKLAILTGLVDVYQAMNHPERAKPLLLEMEKHISPAASLKLRARWLFTIANIHHGLGNPTEAGVFFRQAMDLLTTTEDPHPQTLSVMSGLANHLRRRDRLAESETLYRRVIEQRTHRLGANHHLTQKARTGLALCLMDQGRNEEAEPLITDVTRALTRTNASHPETLANIRRMAAVMRSNKNYERALQVLGDLVTHYRDNGLSASPDALKARSNLADLFILVGDHEAAIRILNPTIQELIRLLGHDHITTTTAMMTLGQALEGSGNRPRAEETYRQAIDLLTVSRPYTRELPYYRAIRAHNLSGMRHFVEAERILLESLAATSPGSAYHTEIQTYLDAHYRARAGKTSAE